ncbi:MAG: serine/threonine-protein kinase, partial [Polyangiales bacterium]
MTTAPPSLIAARYRVIREIGRGGMGVVYLVEHVHTGEQFALKLLLEHAGASAEVIERFRREARAPARIKSENVVKITDADVAPELNGAPFLVMELLEGENLDARLRAQRTLSPAEVVWIFRKLASALDKAHALGITHRDLKPENIFLHHREGETVVKILDFGISKVRGEGGGDLTTASLTKSGAMMGTPLFMSPEQAQGDTARIGPATDIWALGLIAYQLLTGQPYWRAQTLAMLMAQIVSMPMEPPSTHGTVPAGFDAWFAVACDRDPARRFATVGAAVEALAAALSGAGAFDATVALAGSSPDASSRLPAIARTEAMQTNPVFAHSQ